jgi:hypothetical protein
MHQLVSKLIALLNNSVPSPFDLFDAQITPVIQNLENLFNANPLQPVPVSATVFAESTSEDWDLEFLAKCFSSHLQTHGCTIVIGKDAQAIQKVNILFTMKIF